MDNEEVDNQGYIKGDIVFTIFENASNHFSIVKINVHETTETYEEKDIVAKGYFANLQKGVVYQFFGELETHPRFGVQYNISSYQTYVPETKEAVITYLSSELFEGVGKKTATAIVDHLGEQAVTKILEDPELLANIPNLNQKTARTLAATLKAHQGFEQIAVKLTKYGIGLKMAQELYTLYKEETMRYIQEDPYHFVFEVEGFSFITADKIAELNQLSTTHPNRIRASCIHALQLSVLDGHVYLPLIDCIQKMKTVLQEIKLEESVIVEQIEMLSQHKNIILQDEKVYLPSLYYAEDHFSSHLKRLMQHKVQTKTTDAELMRMIGDIEEEEILSYGEEQFTAIKRALDSKVMILTGGPGTGKTTVIKGILKAYAEIHNESLDRHDYDKKADYPFVLTAPTGRAAKRLQESTGIKAMTIHRLLGWDGEQTFEKNEYEQLDGKYLIVDEFSMVDTWLANHLFKAIPKDMQVLLVGDEDQLPSVGPGQVLADLYDSELIPYVTLNEVYRQKEGSKIIQLAHQIKHNQCTEADIQQSADFSFIPCTTSQVLEVVETIMTKAKDKEKPLEDIQILAPMYKTDAGITEINKQMQTLINPKTKQKRERSFYDKVFRVGDRVLQLVNQPEDHVYNGDIGEIVQIFTAKENEENEEQLIVQFDENEVVYTRKTYGNITHAYCISIHKSQGSEFPIVILPIVRAYRRMLRKNLLYTAITRSKQSLIICGEKEAFFQGIETIEMDQRYTTLPSRLSQKLSDEEQENKEDMMEATDIAGEEDSLSPYDFM
ncbi:MAG TPA: ATP-dependent RecD-like DNA helicase [Pseudogracilibacillus sp.]|nr:ATP-dependent RecD-like DNA helicase [Pseudogracilibacillus sp.]